MILHPGQPVEDIPSQAEGRREESHVTLVDFSGDVQEVQTITCPSQAGATQADYVVISNAAGETVAIWADINEDGTAPTGAAYVASDYQVMVPVATSDTDADVAAALVTAVEASADFSSFGFTLAAVDEVVTLTFTLPGDITDPARHNADDSGNGSFAVAKTTDGVLPDLDSTSFKIHSSDTAYYVWFNVNGLGTDPEVAEHTGVEVALNGNESPSEMAAKAATAINALDGLNAEGDGAVLKIYADDVGAIVDAEDEDSGLTITIRNQGYAANSQLVSPADSPSELSNNPSIIS